jgi:hypothetical protein
MSCQSHDESSPAAARERPSDNVTPRPSKSAKDAAYTGTAFVGSAIAFGSVPLSINGCGFCGAIWHLRSECPEVWNDSLPSSFREQGDQWLTWEGNLVGPPPGLTQWLDGGGVPSGYIDRYERWKRDGCRVPYAVAMASPVAKPCRDASPPSSPPPAQGTPPTPTISTPSTVAATDDQIIANGCTPPPLEQLDPWRLFPVPLRLFPFVSDVLPPGVASLASDQLQLASSQASNGGTGLMVRPYSCDQLLSLLCDSSGAEDECHIDRIPSTIRFAAEAGLQIQQQ